MITIKNNVAFAFFVLVLVCAQLCGDVVVVGRPVVRKYARQKAAVNIAGLIEPEGEEQSITWTYTGPIQIEDGDTAWVTIMCDPNGLVPAGNAVTKVELYHSITHTWAGDLDVQVTNDDNVWTVRSSDINNESEDIVETVTDTNVFFGDDPNQVWYYQVRDVIEADTGQLEEIELTVYYTGSVGSISVGVDELEVDCSSYEPNWVPIEEYSIMQELNLLTVSSKRQLLDEGEIQNMFDREGRARVIVNLKNPVAAGARRGLSVNADRKQMRSQIKQARDRVLDKFRGKRGFKSHYEFENIPAFSATITAEQLSELMADGSVASVEPAKRYKCLTRQGLPLINAYDSRSANTGAGISIAICDTGIDYNHPMLGEGGFPNDKVIGGYDFGDEDFDPMPYDSAHGTACAGVAAGFIGSEGDYIGGVAPASKLYALKVTEGVSEGIWTDTIVSSWDWCVSNQYADPNNPIMVISVSLGGEAFSSVCDGSVYALAVAAQNAADAGITIVAASGNEGYCDAISEPACVSNVISVGAVYDRSTSSGGWCVESGSCVGDLDGGCDSGYMCTDTGMSAGEVNCYSNSADILDVLAPSYSTNTTDITGSGGYDPNDYTDGFAGTSAATPYVAGAVAVLQQAAYEATGNYLSSAEIRNILVDSGSLVLDPKSAIYTPLIDVGAAIEAVHPCDGTAMTIYNMGTGVLSVTGMDLPVWLSEEQEFPVDIAPGGSLKLCLKSDCGAVCISEISYSDNITIYSNDPDNPLLDVAVAAVCAKCESRPGGDISGDCIVDLFDFAELASTWLGCGYNPSSYCN